jgi:hypothetical protein
LKKELGHVKAIGTDGETALYNAFSGRFPEAVHVRFSKEM